MVFELENLAFLETGGEHWAVLGPLFRPLGSSWTSLGILLGPMGGVLGRLGAILGPPAIIFKIIDGS